MISIHTPVKGVTAEMFNALEMVVISIHTPVKGVTVDCVVIWVYLGFQSTHP